MWEIGIDIGNTAGPTLRPLQFQWQETEQTICPGPHNTSLSPPKTQCQNRLDTGTNTALIAHFSLLQTWQLSLKVFVRCGGTIIQCKCCAWSDLQLGEISPEYTWILEISLMGESSGQSSHTRLYVLRLSVYHTLRPSTWTTFSNVMEVWTYLLKVLRKFWGEFSVKEVDKYRCLVEVLAKNFCLVNCGWMEWQHDHLREGKRGIESTEAIFGRMD